MAKAKYDGLAQWYEHEQRRVADRPDAPLEQFAELAEPAGGLIVEIGCGTGLAAAALTARGWQVGGIDISIDQLSIAHERCRWVAQADAHQLPVGTAGLAAAGLAFVHTDVDAFEGILREIARVLQPGGRLVCLGIHPSSGTTSRAQQRATPDSASYRGIGIASGCSPQSSSVRVSAVASEPITSPSPTTSWHSSERHSNSNESSNSAMGSFRGCLESPHTRLDDRDA